MRPLRAIALAGLAAALAGCGVTSPQPEERFYRLGDAPETAPSDGKPHLRGHLCVRPPSASGPQGERPILYSAEPDALELRQYHYHLWVDSPPRLLQRRLIRRLRAANAADTISSNPPPRGEGYVLDGALRRFERVPDNGGWRAVVAWRLSLRRHPEGRVVMTEEHTVEIPAEDASMPATVRAFSTAADRLADAFLADIRDLGQPPSPQ